MQVKISFHRLSPSDKELIRLVAGWYLQEWNIPEQQTVQKLSDLPEEGFPFQLLLKVNDVPVGTGRLYDHVGLLDREPRFKTYKHWLALVYTAPASRNKGYGTLLCTGIERVARSLQIHELHLFTHTAESLYDRLEWKLLERITLPGRDIAIMHKEL